MNLANIMPYLAIIEKFYLKNEFNRYPTAIKNFLKFFAYVHCKNIHVYNKILEDFSYAYDSIKPNDFILIVA